jgi:hypothetical protein
VRQIHGMSVLVESHSIIVRRRTLDERWPGGADAYLTAAVSAEPPANVACADDDLTSVSFLALEDCQEWFECLENHGIEDRLWLDPTATPPAHCKWIEWRVHPDGFTYAWLAGTDPDSVVAPKTLRPVTLRRGVGDQSHMMRLATEDGVEYWLDLETGEQIASLAERADSAAHDDAAPPPSSDSSPLMPVVRAALDQLEWKPDVRDDAFARIRVAGTLFDFNLLIVIDDAARTIVCYGIVPVHADPDRRAAAVEAIVRINQGLRIGSFDLDFSDGQMRYRTGCDVEGGALTEHMVRTMLGNVCCCIDQFSRALMLVLFGQASAEEAVRRALDGGDA